MLAIFDYQLLEHSLIVGVLLFALGVVGFVARRSVGAMLVSAGVMLQGVVLSLMAFGTFHGSWSGQALSLAVLLAAMAIGTIAAAVMAALARAEGSLDTDRLRRLGNEAAGDAPRSLPGAHSAAAAIIVPKNADEGIDD
jgi:NADH:ubiquinone oxidoreductase subunit K